MLKNKDRRSFLTWNILHPFLLWQLAGWTSLSGVFIIPLVKGLVVMILALVLFAIEPKPRSKTVSFAFNVCVIYVVYTIALALLPATYSLDIYFLPVIILAYLTEICYLMYNKVNEDP